MNSSAKHFLLCAMTAFPLASASTASADDPVQEQQASAQPRGLPQAKAGASVGVGVFPEGTGTTYSAAKAYTVTPAGDRHETASHSDGSFAFGQATAREDGDVASSFAYRGIGWGDRKQISVGYVFSITQAPEGPRIVWGQQASGNYTAHSRMSIGPMEKQRPRAMPAIPQMPAKRAMPAMPAMKLRHGNR